jgi:hypothetical protein
MSTPANTEFVAFPKMARLSRTMIVTEKIDGTNAQVFITEDGDLFAGSRTRWITPQNDNFGFAAWVEGNREELLQLGPGRHFGEWWGSGIQRGYGLTKGEKRFSLFNVVRWCLHGKTPGRIETADQRTEKYQEVLPECCGLVPVLYRGAFSTLECENALYDIATQGSVAAPGFMDPEGIVAFHVAGNVGFKKTLERDDTPKTLQA